MTIRKGKKEDWDELVKVYKDAFTVHGIFTKDDEFIKKYLGKFDNFLVAEEDGKLVGVLVIVENKYDNWSVFNFKHIAVAKDYQGKGIGSQLLKKAEELAGTGKVEIRVAENMSEEGAVEFYEKNRYEKEGALKSHYRKGETCFVMGKVL